MSLVKFSVNNSPLINIVMLIVFIVGIFVLADIPKEEMPAVDFGSFIIIAWYPGVSPAEIETLVMQKIEDEIADVENIDYISSTAQEGRATVYVVFEPNADIDKAELDLKSELDKVTDLPEDVEDPMMIRLNMREVNEICDVMLGGDFSGNAIREIAENMREGLLNIPNVSKVEIRGTRERQIWVEADAVKLNEYGLSLNDLRTVIQMRNMNVPGGTVNFGKAEFIIRTVGEFNSAQEMQNLVVRTDATGRILRLKDVAVVSDTLEERSRFTKLDGKPGVRLEIYKKAEGNIIQVMRDVRVFTEKFQKGVPGLELSVRNDGSIPVSNALNTLSSSALLGVLLVFAVLLIFLGWRNALFAAWGIPFSFFLTFILMRYFDVTMNNLTLFGLVLVLGMIVDDAIIVLENVHRYMEEGLCPKDAVIKGVSEIMWPVIAAVTTTTAAFLPMLLMEGMMGKFMRVFPIVVSLALISSLIESLVILPSHIADLSKPLKEKHRESKLQAALTSWYRKAITRALKHRLLTMAVVIVLFIGALMTVGLRFIQIEFFPKQVPKTIVLKLRTPVGTNLDTTNKMVVAIEEFINTMPQREDVLSVISTVGALSENNQQQMATSNAQMSIDLVDANDRKFPDEQTKNTIRAFLDDLPGLYSYKFSELRHGPPTGKDVELRVKGDNLDRLEFVGDVLKAELDNIPGVVDIEDSFEAGKKEVQIVPRHDKLEMNGLTVSQVAGLVRTASYGSTITTFRGGGVEEYDVILRLQDKHIDSLEDLKNLKIRNNRGSLVYLKDVADFEVTSGYAQINHRDKKRVITVTAETSFYRENGIARKRTSDEVSRILLGNRLTGEEGVLSNFESRFPGYLLESGGTAEEQSKSFRSLSFAFGIAILIIFAILATQFKSYVQPLIVMFTIPFSFIGVIFGLLVTRLPFSLNTMIAVVALAGVVVNDSLVLVDFVNRERRSGVDRWNSLIDAGAKRLRPIILTTVTTIFGVLPMIFSTAAASRDWRPMAVSIAFGLAFATLLTLFVIPVVYSLVDSLFGKLGLTRFKEHLRYEDCIKSE